jgi:transmembrane protein EpsG
MNPYWITLIMASSFAALAAFDKYFRKPAYAAAILTVIVVSSIRYKTGFDFDNYVDIYAGASASEKGGSEIGWIFINRLLQYITSNFIIVSTLSSITIYGLIGYILYRESKYAAIALLAFMVNIPFYWESLAIIRQYIAISLIVMASLCWIDRRKGQFCLLFLLATLFHFTAIIGIIIPILSKWKSRITFILFFGLIAALSAKILEDTVASFSVFEKYQAYFDGRIAAEGKETTGIVVYAKIAISLLLIISLENTKNIPQRKKNLVSNSIIFGYVLFVVLYESIALRRIAQFFTVYEILAIGYITESAIKSEKIFIKYLSRLSIFIYIAIATTLLTKDVWLNPIGKQEDSQLNYEYRSILEQL